MTSRNVQHHLNHSFFQNNRLSSASVEILSPDAQQNDKSHLIRLATNEWPLRSVEVIRIALFDRPPISLPMVYSSNNGTILHRFEISPLLQHTHAMTAFELQRTFSIHTTFNIIATYTFWFLRKHIFPNTCYISEILKLERLRTAELRLKVSRIGSIR